MVPADTLCFCENFSFINSIHQNTNISNSFYTKDCIVLVWCGYLTGHACMTLVQIAFRVLHLVVGPSVELMVAVNGILLIVLVLLDLVKIGFHDNDWRWLS